MSWGLFGGGQLYQEYGTRDTAWRRVCTEDASGTAHEIVDASFAEAAGDEEEVELVALVLGAKLLLEKLMWPPTNRLTPQITLAWASLLVYLLSMRETLRSGRECRWSRCCRNRHRDPALCFEEALSLPAVLLARPNLHRAVNNYVDFM